MNMFNVNELPRTAQQARQLNSSYYFTGKPCKRGHISPRITASSTCGQCVGLTFDRYPFTQPYDFRTVKYGITTHEVITLVSQQNNSCEICGQAFSGDGRGPTGWNVDHCHATGNVRGIICSLCNRGLGMFRDNPNFLRQAANYIEKHNGK